MKEDTKAAMDKVQKKRLSVILKMLEEGKTVDDIRLKLDLSRSRIHQIANAAGIVIPRRNKYCGRHA
jgi:DNA-binding NarL/FixJ family response regulator